MSDLPYCCPKIVNVKYIVNPFVHSQLHRSGLDKCFLGKLCVVLLCLAKLKVTVFWTIHPTECVDKVTGTHWDHYFSCCKDLHSCPSVYLLYHLSSCYTICHQILNCESFPWFVPIPVHCWCTQFLSHLFLLITFPYVLSYILIHIIINSWETFLTSLI